ncbi:MAG: DUF169 domain-containing protein [Dehalococcoidia bacterium]|nr:DUF169 domain-containing protein [Dehalococcoidia bacterium]
MEIQKINQTLEKYIRPQTFPVAVRLVSSVGEIPDRVRMPKRDLGMPVALCQGIALARRYGWAMAMGVEDMQCPLGALTLGFLPAKDKFLDGSFNVPFWVKNQDVRAKIARGMPRLEVGKYTYVVAAPLARADFEPQVIIIYGNPSQVSRLVQAAIYATGESVISSSVGGLACGAEITRAILTDQCQFAVVGGGDRAVAQAHDDEMSFAMPVSKIGVIIEGLEATHKAGMRYPTTSFLTYKPQFPPSFDELTDYLGKGS